MEIGNQRLQQLADFVFGPPQIGRPCQCGDATNYTICKKSVARPKNLGVVGRQDILRGEEHSSYNFSPDARP